MEKYSTHGNIFSFTKLRQNRSLQGILKDLVRVNFDDEINIEKSKNVIQKSP